MMGYFVHDDALDAQLDVLKQNADKIVLTVGEPTSFTNANATYPTASGQKVVEVTTDSADFTIADGDTDGRKVTAAAQSGLTPVADGDADHVAWLDTANSKILHYAPLASTLSVTTSGTVTIPAHSHTARDNAAVA